MLLVPGVSREGGRAGVTTATSPSRARDCCDWCLSAWTSESTALSFSLQSFHNDHDDAQRHRARSDATTLGNVLVMHAPHTWGVRRCCSCLCNCRLILHIISTRSAAGTSSWPGDFELEIMMRLGDSTFICISTIVFED